MLVVAKDSGVTKLVYWNTFNVMYNTVARTNDTTPSSKCDWTFNLCEQGRVGF